MVIKNKYFPAQSATYQDVNVSVSNDPLTNKPSSPSESIDLRLQDSLKTIRAEQTDRSADIPADPATYNPYFDTNGIQRGSAVQQQVVQNMFAESIGQQGLSITYYPFEPGTVDGIWNEDPTVTFPNSFEIDMYLETYEGFEGDGKILTQYGVQFRDQLTMIVAINTWKSRRDNYLLVQGNDSNLQSDSEPREGDLISIPFGLNAINPEVYTPKLFQVNNVTTFRDSTFFQLGNVYVYRLQATLYERSGEDIITTDPITGAEKSADDSVVQSNIEKFNLSVDISPYSTTSSYASGDRVIYKNLVYVANANIAAGITPDTANSGWIQDTSTTGSSIQIDLDSRSVVTSSRLQIILDSVSGNPGYKVTIPSNEFNNIGSITAITHYTNNTGTDTNDLGILNNNVFIPVRDTGTGKPTGLVLFPSEQFTSTNNPIDVSTGFLTISFTEEETNATTTIHTNAVEKDPFATNEELDNADDEIAVDDFTQMRWGKGTGAF